MSVIGFYTKDGKKRPITARKNPHGRRWDRDEWERRKRERGEWLPKEEWIKKKREEEAEEKRDRVFSSVKDLADAVRSQEKEVGEIIEKDEDRFFILDKRLKTIRMCRALVSRANENIDEARFVLDVKKREELLGEVAEYARRLNRMEEELMPRYEEAKRRREREMQEMRERGEI